MIHLLRQLDAAARSSWLRAAARAVLQSHGMSVGRSGADGPDAPDRLLLLDPLRAPALSSRSAQPRLSVVLPARPRATRCLTIPPFRSIVTAASATAMSYARCSRASFAGAWQGRVGRGRGLCGRRQRDRGQCQPLPAGRGERGRVDATQQRRQPPVREYLAALDERERADQSARKPKALSPSDPAAAWTTRGRHKVMFGYSLNSSRRLWPTRSSSTSRRHRPASPKRSMPPRPCSSGPSIGFALAPDDLAADVAYGTGEMLGWLVGRGIDPHIPVWDKSQRDDGTFSRR